MIPAAGWASTVEVRDGIAVLVRRADEPEYQARLVRAAEVLAVTDHPGAERLVAVESNADGTKLTTEYAGGRSLAGSPPTDARGLASLAAALAQILDDLHRAGTVHGPLVPHHVILADGDRPVLCGFSGGQLRREVDDEIWPACTSDDVRTIGALLNPLLDSLPNPKGLALWERSTRILLRRTVHRTNSGQAADAATVARWCATAAEPLHLARSIRKHDGSSLERTAVGSRTSSRSVRRHRSTPQWSPGRLSLVGLVAGAILCALGVVGLVKSSSSLPPGKATQAPVTSKSTSSPPTSRHCSPPSGPAKGTLLDISGDGCPEWVLVDGSTLVVAGTSYHLGQPGDLVEVGDWNGNGIATPALVRPTTGAVFAFESWPSSDQPLVAHPIARVHDVTHVQIRHGGNGHDSLVLDRSSGPPVPLDLDRPDSRGSTP